MQAASISVPAEPRAADAEAKEPPPGKPDCSGQQRRPAKRRRQGQAPVAALPKVVENALRDPKIVKEVGGARVLGLGGPLRCPEPDSAGNCENGAPSEDAILEAMLRSPHSLQIDESDFKELLVRAELSRMLARNAPRRPYRRRRDDLKTVVHWGQRKLLLSEIEFLTKHGADCARIIYAGAAPGVHVPFLSSLFPHLKFILVDPGDFCKKLGEAKNVEVRQEFFTAELAATLKEGELAAGSGTLFISDVRTADFKIMSREEVDSAIARDMAMQQEWVRLLQPRKAMLKFCLPYAAGKTEYLDGEIFLPVWGPPTTTETRLITDGAAVRAYDHSEYEEQMFYFNTVTRVKRYHTPLVGEGLCESFDSASEMTILQEYLAYLAGTCLPAIELSGVAPPGDDARLASLFRCVGRHSSVRGRHLLTVLPLDAREKWFSAKVFDPETGQYLEACSQEGQELLCAQRAIGDDGDSTKESGDITTAPS